MIQSALYLEHRARLAILKAAIEDTVEGGEISKKAEAYRSFSEGCQWLAGQPNFHRYAVLWQNFLWSFGGFILEHRRQKEYELLSDISGVPAVEVGEALSAFDRFFPLRQGTWIGAVGHTSVHGVKQMPKPAMGIGLLRRVTVDNLSGADLEGNSRDYTGDDLIKFAKALLAAV